MASWIKEHCVFSGIAGTIITLIVSIFISFFVNTNTSDKKIKNDNKIYVENIKSNGDVIITNEKIDINKSHNNSYYYKK